MQRHVWEAWRMGLALTLSSGIAANATAQQVSLGTYQWQSQPYCNVVTVSVTQVDAATFRLEGFDDQCGAAARASVIGTAFLNPNGSVGIGLSIVGSPGGAPVHLDARITAPTFGGVWRDSTGASGQLVFGPGAPVGAPRPLGVPAPPVNTVIAGGGLVGGGSASTVNVGVNFAGPGAALTVARSDHTHAAPGTANTAVGGSALAANVSGSVNTAVGHNALSTNTAAIGNTALGAYTLSSVNSAIADNNTAVGAQSLWNTTSGYANVSIGAMTMQLNTSGHQNVAVGTAALADNTTGEGNIAIGYLALQNLGGASSDNIGIGREAGVNATGGTANVFIGNEGEDGDTQTIKIGTNQTRTFIAGVNGGVLDGASDVQVSVDAYGKLGTTVSSARFKTHVADLEPDALRLQQLHPVSFLYLPTENRGSHRQFGLIAEEVAQVLPELVVNDAAGQPYTVRYQQLPPLLLAEVQRLERERQALIRRLDAQARELAELRALIEAQRPR